jgi:hypothetical protein
LQTKSYKRVWGARTPQEGKEAKSRGLKPRNKIILFLHKIYDIIYPKFLSEGSEVLSGVKGIS